MWVQYPPSPPKNNEINILKRKRKLVPKRRIIYNNYIKALEVRLITETGEQMGVVNTRKALDLAKSKGLDLVQVTDKVSPPVCKIGEYGKHLYDIEKKEREVAKKQQKKEHKTAQINYKTSPHDLETKARQIAKFFNKGYKVTVLMRLRGREKAFKDLAFERMKAFLEMLKAQMPVKIDQDIQKKPNGFSAIISKGK